MELVAPARRYIEAYDDQLRLSRSKILIVDDEPSNARLLQDLFADGGYVNTFSTTDPAEAKELFAAIEPDLVLLDLHMPKESGASLLSKLRLATDAEDFIPMVVLSGDLSRDARQQCLELGASDFIGKPFDDVEVRLRASNLLRLRYLHGDSLARKLELERRVLDRTVELDQARMELLHRLCVTAEYRDDDTGQHTRRVGDLAGDLAQIAGADRSFVEMVRRAAPLHDIGKVAIPDAILLKPAKLSPDELTLMREHTVIGGRILAGSRSPLLRLAEEIALTHHERWDGAGYPRRLLGDLIPLSGRLVALADVFDALTHARPYKEAWPFDRALDEIKRCAGTNFDPELAELFCASLRSGRIKTAD